MRRLSLLLAVLFGSITLIAIACEPAPQPDDDDDDDALDCGDCAAGPCTAEASWDTCAAVTGSPTPAPFCALVGANQLDADGNWACVAALLDTWDCSAGLPSGLGPFDVCFGGGGDDDTGDDDDSVGPCNDDQSEDNDDSASATPITVGTHLGYVSCPSDEDWFSINVNTGNYLQVDLTFLDEEGDVELSIKDAAGLSLDSSNSSSDNETAAFLSDLTATYYIVVRFGFSDDEVAGNTYDMTVATGVPSAENCSDIFDNDFDGDIDCFDSDCAGSPACTTETACDDDFDNDADGDADCLDSDCANSPLCVCPTDGYEENDTYAVPSPISAGSYGVYDDGTSSTPATDPTCTNCLSTCLGDEDWYSFSSATPVTFTLAFDDDEGDIDCKLYDADSSQWTPDPTLDSDGDGVMDNVDPDWEPSLDIRLASSSGVNDSEDCSGDGATNGNYLLRVFLYPFAGDPGATGNTYALQISN